MKAGTVVGVHYKKMKYKNLENMSTYFHCLAQLKLDS